MTVQGIHPGPFRAFNQPNVYGFRLWEETGGTKLICIEVFFFNPDPLRENASPQKNDMKVQEMK